MGDTSTSKDFFDKAYVISLKRRPGRLKHFMDQYEPLADSGQWPFKSIEIFEGIDGMLTGGPIGICGAKNHPHHPSVWGCRMSHLRIIENALMRDHGNILIFEDDAVFTPYITNTGYIDSLLSALPADWDMLYFGYYLYDYVPETYKDELLLTTHHAFNTHAYAISRRYLKFLYRSLVKFNRYKSILLHVDQHYSDIAINNDSKIFLSYHPLAKQNRGLPRDIKY